MSSHVKGYLSQTELKGRGWNVRLIDELLGEPDWLKPRPFYGSASPVHLYRDDRVMRAESSEAFKAHMAKREQRAGAVKKMVETKRRKTAELIERLNIEIPEMPPQELINRAVSNYNFHHARDEWEESKSTSACDLAPWGAPDEFRDRICVNYLRHRRTVYHSALSALTSRVGKAEAQRLLWRRIAEEIGRVYPALKDEAERQYARRFGEG
jgi:hypothetical protein